MGVGVGVGAGAWVCRDVGGGEDFCVLLEVVVGSEVADELLPGRVEVSCGTVTVGSWERRVPASNARKDTRTTAPSTMPRRQWDIAATPAAWRPRNVLVLRSVLEPETL